MIRMQAFAALLLLSVASLAASAQQAVREGLGATLGPSLIGGAVDCDRCGDGEFAGVGGYLGLGGYVRPDLLAGAQFSVHTLPLAYYRLDAKFLSAMLQWYPAARKGFHIKGSVGMAWLAVLDNEDEESRRHTLTAPTLGISLGYDIRRRPGFLLTPFASVTRTIGGDYRRNGQKLGPATATAYQIGLGLSWY
jgi:hypothetical protein